MSVMVHLEGTHPHHIASPLVPMLALGSCSFFESLPKRVGQPNSVPCESRPLRSASQLLMPLAPLSMRTSRILKF